MRHSAHLTGSDYRQLLEIIDLTYGASCPDALFPPLFEELAKALGCSSALYLATGAGLPRPKARGAIMFEQSLQLAREYTDYYWTLDPLCISGWIKKSNRATRVSDLVPYSSFANSEFVLDFLARVPCYWGLAGFVGSPGHPVGGIGLLRLRHEHDFSERDVAFVRALLPHLSRALSFFELRNQRPRPTGILILDNIGNVVYSNEAAANVLKEKSAEAIRLPIGQGPRQESTIFQSDQGDYAVGLETIPGPYKVVSLEPVMHDSLRARLAMMGLTPRQQEIASRVLSGASNKRIAGGLHLTEQTVKDHIHAIFRKLGIHHRAELAARVLPLALEKAG
jgi:DNA-binding CsgD family transcriptional regulator